MSLMIFELLFPDDDACWRRLEALRWPDGAVCPKCGSVGDAAPWTPRPHRWRCHHCGYRFHAAQGTVMEGSHLHLRIWFLALHLLAETPELSSVALGRQLALRQKSAWDLARRVRRLAATNSGLFHTIAAATGVARSRRSSPARNCPASGQGTAQPAGTEAPSGRARKRLVSGHEST